MADDDDPGEGPLIVVVLDWAKHEALKILSSRQYWYVVPFVRRLVEWGDRKATSDLDVKQCGDFWELRLKGGFLGKINLRIYFAFISERREIVVLMTYKKEEDRRVSPSVSITLEDRLEDYLAGRARVAARHREAVEKEGQEDL